MADKDEVDPLSPNGAASVDDSSTGSQTLWHGRFEAGPAEVLMAFSASIGFDIRLGIHDVRGSAAHVSGLRRAGVLSDAETEAVQAALNEVAAELTSGTLEPEPADEDIHTAIERRVTEIAGEAGAKLHTGRSRNDQVATAFRLWLRDASKSIIGAVLDLRQVLIGRAEQHQNVYLPGYTHLQRAQPIPLAHHLLAHAWALGRDAERLFDGYCRLDVSPLGAGALAGSSLPLDPATTATELGFASSFANSLDATSDRDFVAEFLFSLTMLAVHLSRIGEELVLWSSSEFGFVELDDQFATGSSMMPQKKNPDIAELVRGKSGRLIGNLTGLLATLKGLPLAYNRDLQEDKEPVFDSYDQLMLALGALSPMIDTLKFDKARMMEVADDPYAIATDLAELLVESGMAFRKAHAVVGDLVQRSLRSGTALNLLVAESPDFDEDALKLFEPGAALDRRVTPGGAGFEPVVSQLETIIQDQDALASRLGKL